MGGDHNLFPLPTPTGWGRDTKGAPHEHSKVSHWSRDVQGRTPWWHGGCRCRGLIRQSYNASPLLFLLPGASVQPPHFFLDLRFSESPSKQTLAQNLKTTKAKYLHTLQSPSSQEARRPTRPPSSGAEGGPTGSCEDTLAPVPGSPAGHQTQPKSFDQTRLSPCHSIWKENSADP